MAVRLRRDPVHRPQPTGQQPTTGCGSLRQQLNGADIYAVYSGPFATRDSDSVQVRHQCTLGADVHLGRGTRVNDRVKIQNAVQVFGPPSTTRYCCVPAS